MSGLNHPEVQQWLARLDSEAASLPEDRRVELRTSVEEHLADARRGKEAGRISELVLLRFCGCGGEKMQSGSEECGCGWQSHATCIAACVGRQRRATWTRRGVTLISIALRRGIDCAHRWSVTRAS